MWRIYDKQETYTVKAQKEGYPARSVYKLQEINEKFKIIRKGDFVLDLGAAPGSWLLYASKIIEDTGGVVGIDKAEITIKLPKNAIFLQKDIMDFQEDDLKVKKYNVVVSDMAPSTSGMKSVDTGRSLELCEKALEIAIKFLKPRGSFVCKILESESVRDFLKEIEKYFKTVKIFRTQATPKGSKEVYIIAKGFKKED